MVSMVGLDRPWSACRHCLNADEAGLIVTLAKNVGARTAERLDTP